ncbi:Putative formate dehydrogenase oxidoreductase protein [Klebsiella pneumoniae IS53]|nr:Putative formate dehydrogenase oxidoreductase protein [Klebsiella pneumoniae IS53]
MTWEATTKRVTPAFLAANTVSSLLAKSDFELEGYGRLTHPLVYDRDSDTLRPVAWEQAFARIGEILRGLQPDEVEFYTSGRASNEAAWLFQLFAREYGTNNFPDCSNMCHESTSVGLPQSIGIGKGTVSLDDFDQTELVISIGHNPGTNHPRMMGTLHELSRRGVPIIVFNPLRERALERFCRSAERNGDGDPALDADRLDLLPGTGRRRRGGVERDRQSAAAAGGGAGQCARPRVYCPTYPGIHRLRR